MKAIVLAGGKGLALLFTKILPNRSCPLGICLSGDLAATIETLRCDEVILTVDTCPT
jgi:hypothetical protein